MSRVRRNIVAVTICGALSLPCCSTTDEAMVGLDGVSRATDSVPPDADPNAQHAMGGQPESQRRMSSSVRPNTDVGSSSGGRLGTGGVIAPSTLVTRSSGGTMHSLSVPSTAARGTTGGALGLGTPISSSGKGGFGTTTSPLRGLGGVATLPIGGMGSRAGASGSPTIANASGGAGSSGDGSGARDSVGTSPSSLDAADPVMPAIDGPCPSFTTGTVTAAGLGGIALQVGPKRQGTGSLLFYWHGTGSSSSEVTMRIPASVQQEILAQGGIIASFQGSLGTGGDCSGTAIFSKDDFKAADQIAACAARDHGIDPRRIYTTGCSAGGLQSGCMAALRSSYLAASVPNSGGEIFAQTLQDPLHIPATMTMHGGASDWVIVSFTDTSAIMDKQMDDAGGFVVNCNHGGGHCGAPSALYVAAWEFMKAHPFGVKPSPYVAGLPTAFPSYCRIY